MNIVLQNDWRISNAIGGFVGALLICIARVFPGRVVKRLVNLSTTPRKVLYPVGGAISGWAASYYFGISEPSHSFLIGMCWLTFVEQLASLTVAKKGPLRIVVKEILRGHYGIGGDTP